MDALNEISSVYQHKKQLERQLKTLEKDEKIAQTVLQDCQIHCQKENLDIRKFEGNDFKQFWFKLRGTYEERVLENNEKVVEAMRSLNDAKSHVFDISQEKAEVTRQLKLLEGADEAYEKALALHIEHMNYSIHREEIVRMQEKICYDEYQLRLSADARNLIQLALRRSETLIDMLKVVQSNGAENKETDDQVEIKIISAYSELRVQLHQLEQIILDIDALEAEYMQFSNKLTVNTLDLFFNKGSAKLHKLAIEGAFRDFEILKNSLNEGLKSIEHLLVEVDHTKNIHQKELETFINDTIV